MNEKFSECQTPFTRCWCEAVPGRMNNPHCKEVASVSIQSDFLSLIIVAGILYYMLMVFKYIKPLSFKLKRNKLWNKNYLLAMQKHTNLSSRYK